MKPSILTIIRKQTGLIKFLVFLLTFSQVYGQGYAFYLNRDEKPVALLRIPNEKKEDHHKSIFNDSSNIQENLLNPTEKGKTFSTSSVVAQLTPRLVNASSSSFDGGDNQFYISDIKEGVIGKDKDHPIDQVFDNVFNINIANLIASDQYYTLDYDLYGVKKYTDISKVINDDLAIGGNSVEKTEYWNSQSEPLANKSLVNGNNTIIFTIPSDANYTYRVRNVRISLHNGTEKLVSQVFNSYSPAIAQKNVLATTEAELSLATAKLVIEKSSLKETQNFSITPLRDIDIPALSSEMVNVTQENSGYRFLPHGEHFSSPAKVFIGYDKSKIPAGYTEQDIKTFFFDRVQKKWVALEKDSLIPEKQVVVSNTTHFTDMINGIIKVPESPETGSYAPNSIKDIKAADPTTGVVSIAPPSANNMGTVNTSFPIKLPAGRNGMQPSLSINYSSEGGNGWLGLGWDLSIPSISIDTRWGVPTYGDGNGDGVYDEANAFETEIYTIGGEQLTFKDGEKYVLPNRTEGFQKLRGTADKQFYPRIEGAYNKIIRHGSSPSTYWWEVIGKDGTKSYFGGDGVGVDENAVIRQPKYVNNVAVIDNTCNIIQWNLRTTNDTNQNYVYYFYNKSNYNGNDLGKGGQEVYIQDIYYTLNSANNPPKNYKVIFLNDSSRKDIQVNARLGAVLVTSKRLSNIEIYYGSEKVRGYVLKYKDGAFKKSLLESITENDSSNAPFYTNKIEYNDNTTNDVATYVDNTINSSATDDVINASILGASESSNSAFGFSLGAGIVNLSDTKSSNPTLRSGTLSFDYSYTKDRSKQLVSLNDLDGDGLPDKFFYNGGFKYRKNNITPYAFNSFSSVYTPIGGTEIDKTTGHTNSFGTTLTVGSPLTANVTPLNLTTSRSVTENYFTDANGDGITDIVENGIVKFGVVNIATGVVNYEANSNNTPNPINPSSFGSIVTDDPNERATLEKENPLHDIVRVWKAPYTGTITIDNAVTLNNNPVNGQDGVDIVVQHNNTEISNRFSLVNTTTQSFSLSRAVNKGDYIYFRVMSKDNGENDEVNWPCNIYYPSATNPNIPQTTDPNGLEYYKFGSGQSKIFTSKSGVGAISTGNVTITGTFTKPFTTDAYTLYIDINRNGQFLQRIHIASGSSASTGDPAITYNINKQFAAQEGDEIHLVVFSSSNINWGVLSFSNLKATFIDPTDATQSVDVPIVPEYRFYNWVKSTNGSGVVNTPQGHFTNTLTTPRQVTIHTFIAGNGPATPRAATLRFVVKKRSSSGVFDFVGSKTIDVPAGFSGGTITDQVGISPSIIFTANPYDQIFYEFYTDDADLMRTISVAQGWPSDNTVSSIFSKYGDLYLVDKDDIFDTTTSGSYPMNTATDGRFGTMYRNWGSFSYNGNPPYAASSIDQSVLFVSTDTTNSSNQQLYDKRFIQTYPNSTSLKYQGVTDLIYASGNTLSSSRMGIANIAAVLGMSNPSGSGTNVVTAPKRITKTSGEGNSLGGSTPASSLNVSHSKSTSKSITDYIDLNGDKYPDAVGDKVTFTNMLGSYTANPRAIIDGNTITKTEASSDGISTGSNIPMPAISHNEYEKVTENGVTKNKTDKDGKDVVAATRSIDIGLNFGAGSNNSEDKGEFTLNDINGDGLPDRLYKDGISLNLGYSFAPKEAFPFGDFRVGNSETSNISAGVSVAGSNLFLATTGKTLFNGSIAFGGGGSQTDSYQTKMFADINGDGLVDKVRYDNSTKVLFASLNLGNSFDAEKQWASNASISNSTSRGQSFNVAVTAGVVIPIPTTTLGAKISLTPSYNTGTGDSNTSYEISDIDGDGYPDLLINATTGNFSNKTLNAKISTIGTTNLLKKVILPTGGTWEVEYTRVGNTYDMPQSKYVMTSVKINDNFTGDTAFKPDISKIRISYKNPYYSRRERAFYGFDNVNIYQLDTNDNIFRKTEQAYLNRNYYLKGLLVNEILKDGAFNIWTEKKNVYKLRYIHSPNTDNPNLNQQKELEKNHTDYACFLAVTYSESKFYEGQTVAGKITSTSISEYDQWGNAVKVIDKGDSDIGTSEEITSIVKYEEVATGKYVIAPTKITNNSTPDVNNPNATVIRGKRAEYNSLTGDLKNIITLDNGVDYATYSFDYDNYGNIIKSTGPANDNNQRFFHKYEYDIEVKTYPIKVEDAFGYSSTTKYDFRFGVPLYTEDMNLQPMKYEYDSFGRTTKIIGPYELFSDVANPWTIKFIYPGYTDNFEANPAKTQHFAKTIHFDPENPALFSEDKGIITVTIADGLGAAIQVKKSASIYNPATGLDEEKYIVSGKVVQDAFGRALKTYYPTVESTLNTSYVADVDSVAPTINTYDVLDRVTSTKLPGEDLLSTVKYGFANDVQGRKMFETIFTDELGTIKKSYTDVKGRTTSVWEPSNTGDIKTQFTHDAVGNILKVVDVAGNETISQYDNLGRRTSYKHPDSGTTNYEYDKASNLRYKTNAANEKVEYKYNFNRLSEVVYLNYTENSVKYYYGDAMNASAMDNNAVGRLWYQTDATGSQYLKYGKLGELTYQRRSVAVPGAGVYWFGTEWQYDTWNRVKSITYPDGELVTYAYNKAGNLKSMSSKKDAFDSQSIIKNLGYDKFEQRVFLEYGNGTKTTYEYETERRRLLKLNAQTKANRAFQQNVYQYDVVSNVLEINNNAPFTTAGLLGGGTNYSYSYDDLYRLTSASGNWRGMNSAGQEERQRYTVSMAYDNMHNVTRKDQKHERSMDATGNTWINMEPTSYRLNYKYPTAGANAVRPHAPTTIVDEPNKEGTLCCDVNNPQVKYQNYIYDAKGNPTQINQQTCNVTEAKTKYLWDEENRLRFVDTNPSTPEVDGSAIYTYDAGGERVIKNVLTTDYIYTFPGAPVETATINNYTIFPNGLISVKLGHSDNPMVIFELPSYTKHYYAGSQRISSKLGLGENVGQFNCAWLIIPFGSGSAPINEKTTAKEKLDANTVASLTIMNANKITPPINYGQNAGYNEICVSSYEGTAQEKNVYWYHPDHLGSSSFITGLDGEVTQNIEYFPSGEVFVENHKNDKLNSQYKFNGKEQDSETGYYYYGARYYNPRVSLWLNVDPLADYNPFYNSEHYIDGQHNGGVYNSGNLNPYIYCYQSPVVYFDPNGKQVHFSNRPIFKYDSGFSNFKKETPTAKDRFNYSIWYSKGVMAKKTLLPNGGAAYLHYLGNTGTSYNFNFSDYLNNDKSGQQLVRNISNIAKKNAEKVLDRPGSISYYSQGFQAYGGSVEFPYPDTEDWQKAIGAFNFYYKADLNVTKVKGGLKYSLNLTIYAEDKYNFNPGQKDIASGTPDDVNGRFEVVGMAKEFMQQGVAKVKKTIEWTIKKP